MVTGLEGDIAQVFATHRRRLRVAGIGAPGWLAMAEAMCRFIVRSRLEPTNVATGEASADDRTVSTLVLSFEDAAEALQISRRTVERMARNGELPTVTVGGRPRVRRTDLDHYVQGLEVRSMPHADAEIRAEFATAGREEMSYGERARVESIVAEMTAAAEHRGDTGPLRVVWQREGHDVGLERRFSSRTAADAFAATLGANHEAGPLLRLDVDDGTGSFGVDPAVVRRAELARRRH